MKHDVVCILPADLEDNTSPLEQPACKKRYLERLSLKTQRQRFFRRLLDESSLQAHPTAKMAIGRNI